MKTYRYLFACLFIVGVLDFQAQTASELPALITDRPDATESPTVVPRGYFQIETGFSYEEFSAATFDQKNITYNTSLIRYGLLENLELRIGWDLTEEKTVSNLDKTEAKAYGFSPLLAGVKVGISEEKGILPEIGLLAHLYLPFTAAPEFKPQYTGGDIIFSMAHTLTEQSSLGYNIGAAWGADSPEVSYVYTLAYGYSLTDKFGLYAELYGTLPENSKPTHLWDAGLTYLVNNALQLDATIGSGITKGQDLLLSSGLSIRIP